MVKLRAAEMHRQLTSHSEDPCHDQLVALVFLNVYAMAVNDE